MTDPRSNPANGKETRRWCDSCGTLQLGPRCSVCGGAGREFEINSPGDIRPAFGDSVGIVEDLLRKAFGTCSPIEGRSLFFNKVPGEDRTDEVIAHGRVIAVLRFDLRADELQIELRQGGAELFAPVATTNVVRIAGVSGHLKGKGVSGENVTECIGEFPAGAPLIVLKGQKVGPGTASVPSSSIRSQEKTVRIKDLDIPSGLPLSPKAGRDTFVRVNRTHLEKLERTGVSEIRSCLRPGIPLTVAFSGGKDSLAAYGLTAAASKDFDLLFTNTGLEFPETLEYVESFAKKHGRRLHMAEAGNGFRANVDIFGPPAKDFRWCCKVCKLGPITDLIARDFPKGTVTTEGNRALESFARSETKLSGRNPFIPNQEVVNPVRAWSAAEVWGYIWMRGLEYNPLYERDYERLGCYLCASCLASEWRNTARIHPEMYSDWEAYLHRYAREHGLPPEYVDMGFWRWKALPPKMRQLANDLDLRTEPEGGSLSLRMLKGASVCTAGGYSAEAVVTLPSKVPFERLAEGLCTVGKVKSSPEYEIALVRTPDARAKVFGGGQVSVTAETEKDAERMFTSTVKALIRAGLCTSCGICEKACSKGAIRIKDGLHIDPSRCNACGKCEKSCMVVHYYDKIMAGRTVDIPKAQKPRRQPPKDNRSRGANRGRRPYGKDSRSGGNRRQR